MAHKTIRVQVPNNHILTQNLYHNSYYPKPKYLIGYLDPLGNAKADEKLKGNCSFGFRVWGIGFRIFRVRDYRVCRAYRVQDLEFSVFRV